MNPTFSCFESVQDVIGMTRDRMPTRAKVYQVRRRCRHLDMVCPHRHYRPKGPVGQVEVR